MATETADERNASSMDIHKALDDEVKIRLVKEVLAEISQKNPEDAKTMFREYGVSATVISYLENTGQLKDGPALLKRVPDADLYSPISAAALKKIRAQYAKK